MSGHDGLAEVLRGHLDPDALSLARGSELAGLLGDIVRTATTAWPHIQLDVETFVGRLASHFSREETLEGWLRRVHAGDLYLATACVERVSGAAETFDRAFLHAVPAILSRGGIRDVQPEEIRQRVREKLLVGACKIADYSGRGTLAAWVNVVTLRTALDVLREQKANPIARSVPLDDVRLAGPDLELEMIKERYREPFKRALRAAVGALTSEQRNLLRLHFVDGSTLDQLAALLQLHRATVARRIAHAREAVFECVRRQLETELGIDEEEFQELLNLLRSRLDLSLSALLTDA